MDSLYKRRWYDKRPVTAQAIVLMSKFPRAIQSIIARGIIDLTNSEFKANELLKSCKTLGRERVLSLHLSQQKKRELDEDSDMFRAMTHMTIISEESQEYAAKKILELLQLLIDYMKSCQQYESEPNDEEVIAMTDTYIKHGKEKAKVVLAKLEHAFARQMKEQSKKVMAKTQSSYQKVIDTPTGEFRIRKED